MMQKLFMAECVATNHHLFIAHDKKNTTDIIKVSVDNPVLLTTMYKAFHECYWSFFVLFFAHLSTLTYQFES